MSAFEKGKQWILALQVMEQMDAEKVRKDAVVHNAAMSACEKCSQWQSAHAILSTMHPKLRDTYSFNAVMAASANARMWEVTIHLLQAMREDSLADSYSYAAAISAYGVQHWAAALALFWTKEVQNLAGPVIFNEILDAVFVEESMLLVLLVDWPVIIWCMEYILYNYNTLHVYNELCIIYRYQLTDRSVLCSQESETHQIYLLFSDYESVIVCHFHCVFFPVCVATFPSGTDRITCTYCYSHAGSNEQLLAYVRMIV